jgi:hypothetical protein
LPAVLPGFVDLQKFFDPPNGTQPLSFIGIHCHDLCRLMHFGSPLVKLVASYSLLELLIRLSDQLEMKCTMGYLMSVIAVLEGLIFYSDLRVAMNCGLCLSIILGWEKLDMQETTMIEKKSWCRLIVEELAMSLAAPCLASKSFINHRKPAIHVAVALLKLQKIPEWMRSVFDDTCISCIIENLAASNLSTEIVFLFRELLNSEFLKTEQIVNLNRVLQVTIPCSISCFSLGCLLGSKCTNQYINNNDNKALVPKQWGWLLILSRLIVVVHMYSFLLFYHVQNHTLITSLINVSFSMISTSVFLGLPSISLFPQIKSNYFSH